MSEIEADELAMLASGFEAAMLDSGGPDETLVALSALGWDELLDAAPVAGVAMAFTLLGASGSSASLLDDVVIRALGLTPAPTTAVVLPAAARTTPPARRVDGRIVIDGTVSSRIDHATTVVLAVESDTSVEFVTVDATQLSSSHGDGLDPDAAYRRIRAELDGSDTTTATVTGSWATAVAAAQVALAHQLTGAARTMLEEARQHAVDREQFGRPVATFQALRHKLAEAFVQIEGAAAAADVWDEGADPLIAALAKSLAGQAARTTATNSQQVLAGIGFTTDHSFHRWLKRSLVVDQLFGSAATLPAVIGKDLIHRGEAPRLVEL